VFLAVFLWGLQVSVLYCVSLIVRCECVFGWLGCVLDGFVRLCLCWDGMCLCVGRACFSLFVWCVCLF